MLHAALDHDKTQYQDQEGQGQGHEYEHEHEHEHEHGHEHDQEQEQEQITPDRYSADIGRVLEAGERPDTRTSDDVLSHDFQQTTDEVADDTSPKQSDGDAGEGGRDVRDHGTSDVVTASFEGDSGESEDTLDEHEVRQCADADDGEDYVDYTDNVDNEEQFGEDLQEELEENLVVDEVAVATLNNGAYEGEDNQEAVDANEATEVKAHLSAHDTSDDLDVLEDNFVSGAHFHIA